MKVNRGIGGATTVAVVVVGLLTAGAAIAQVAREMPGGFGLAEQAFGMPGGRLAQLYTAALAKLRLSQDQKDQIKALVEAEKPVLEALAQQRKDDAEALRAAADATTPDPATVGAAFLKVRADGIALRAEVKQLHDSIVALLTPEQKAAFEAYLDVFKARLRPGRGPNG
jgi:Spy/CpxP family protein refolding chaperone